MHHFFSQYSYNNNEDWFINVTFDVLRAKLDELQFILDGTRLEHYLDEEALMTTTLPSDPAPPEEDLVVLHQELPRDPLPLVEPSLDKFIDECFVKNPQAKTSVVELRARYRLWSRGTDFNKGLLEAFLKENGYKETYVYDLRTKCNCEAYKGLEMIPLPSLTMTNRSSDIEKFMITFCVANVTGRISLKELYEKYAAWKRENDPDFVFTRKEKNSINEYLRVKFLASTIHDGQRVRFGYYGVSFIGSENTGRKTKVNNRKAVQQIDPNTLQVVRTYESITQAATELRGSIASVSVAISSNKIYKHYLFKLVET